MNYCRVWKGRMTHVQATDRAHAYWLSLTKKVWANRKASTDPGWVEYFAAGGRAPGEGNPWEKHEAPKACACETSKRIESMKSELAA